LLSLFDGPAVELHQRPAGDADKVVVVRVPVGVLEAPRPLIGTRSTGQPRVCEELNRAENRCLPNGWVNAARGREKLLGSHVTLESKECVKHSLTGACHLLPTLVKIRLENLPLLTTHSPPSLV